MTLESENRDSRDTGTGQEATGQEGFSEKPESDPGNVERPLGEREAHVQQGRPASAPEQEASDAGTESAGDHDAAGEEAPRPEDLGDGLSILGTVGLERASLETPSSSPELTQPEVLAAPEDRAFAAPDEAAEEPAHPNESDTAHATPPAADDRRPEAALPDAPGAGDGGQEAREEQAQPEQTGQEANPTEAPVVASGATQSDVLTSDAPVADITPKEATPAARASLHGETDEGESHEEDHDLDEHGHAPSDFDQLSLQELQAHLFQQIKEQGSRKNPRLVFELHRRFEQRFNQEKAAALERFVQEGGIEEDFEYSGVRSLQEVEQAIQQLREGRLRDQRNEEEQKLQNLNRKRELLRTLRELVESAETHHSGDRLKALQAEWKAIGPVPQSEAQELWNSYHALLDIYYNNRSIYNELKELDRKRNYDLKIQLCERAEALVHEPSINKSLQELRHLHEEWKNIGPVPNEMRDSIWERFIQASEQVHKRKKEYLSRRNEEEGENLRKKQELISQIEPLQQFSSDRINDWREQTDLIQKLKEAWDKIGLVPKSEADSINKRFWGSYKAFFQHKNLFFKSLDEQKLQNLRLKTELCEQAEALKDDPDWNETREKFIQLQKQWKTIGRVPDKHSDKIWDRFRTACNAFFDRKQNEAKQRETVIEKQSAEKEAFFEQLSQQVGQLKEGEGNLDEFNAIIQRWEELDPERHRGNHKLEDRFYGLLEKYLQTVPNLSRTDLEDLKFQLHVNRMRSNPDASHKLHQKEQGLRREIGDLENDIRTLKTNIEFFSRSKNAEKLREEYNTKIEDAIRRIDLLKRQLQVLRS